MSDPGRLSLDRRYPLHLGARSRLPYEVGLWLDEYGSVWGLLVIRLTSCRILHLTLGLEAGSQASVKSAWGRTSTGDAGSCERTELGAGSYPLQVTRRLHGHALSIGGGFGPLVAYHGVLSVTVLFIAAVAAGTGQSFSILTDLATTVAIR